jgi:hypothetical protein
MFEPSDYYSGSEGLPQKGFFEERKALLQKWADVLLIHVKD